MGRKTDKTLVEETNRLSIFKLKPYIGTDNVCMLTWEWNSSYWPKTTALIRYSDSGPDINGERAESFKIAYKEPGQTKEARVILTTTPCHFGGKRYWFKCPMCDRRIGVLYKNGYFACRYCHGLTYYSQNLNHRSYFYSLRKEVQKRNQIKNLLKRKLYYSGEPTRHKRRIDYLCQFT